MSILVVDDDRDLALSLDILLRLEGYAVTVVSSANEALRATSAQDFGLTLLDLRLPDASGMDCVREIRRLKPGAKVVIMTAYGTRAATSEAHEAGALGVVYKPIEVEDMLLAFRAEECGAILVSADVPDAVDNIATTLRAAGYAPFAVRGNGFRPELQELGADTDAVIVDQDATAAHGRDVLHQIARLGRPILVLLVVAGSAAIEDLDARRFAMSVTECLATTAEPTTLMAAIKAKAEESTGASV